MLTASEQEDRHAPQLVEPQTARFCTGFGLFRLRHSPRRGWPGWAGTAPERRTRSALAVQPAGIRVHDLQPGVGGRAYDRSRRAGAGVPATAGASCPIRISNDVGRVSLRSTYPTFVTHRSRGATRPGCARDLPGGATKMFLREGLD